MSYMKDDPLKTKEYRTTEDIMKEKEQMQVTDKHKKQFLFNIETEEGEVENHTPSQIEGEGEDVQYGVPDNFEGQ